DVGRNIGAQLQIDQAEADKRIAQAKAEERRALAVAQEQEMRARVEEMRAKVVESESDVPKALADALRSGNMGFLDHINLQNKVADTKMREKIGNMQIDFSAKPVDRMEPRSE
ncbi:MAG: flotillin-like FloA family protein, partial [Defluviitaleaceae bacterium]|nr:flotillin-like FloA family protein [Defluviitaleaceae bacterium]